MAASRNDGAWVCNECGSREFTGSVSESDLENLACSSCGGWDFHWDQRNDKINLKDKTMNFPGTNKMTLTPPAITSLIEDGLNTGRVGGRIRVTSVKPTNGYSDTLDIQFTTDPGVPEPAPGSDD